MTTVAYRAGVLAADSQATSSYKQKCQKIHKVGDSYFAFCGALSTAYLFIEWLKLDQRDWLIDGKDPPKGLGDDDFEAIELSEEGAFVWDCRLTRRPVLDAFYAIGSGSDFAMGAMAMGADAKEAVRVAAKFDPYTGGAIKKVTL